MIRTLHVGPSGRIRYEIPQLRRAPKLVAELESALRPVVGIRDVRGSSRTATLLVLYDPKLPRAGWETTLASLLGARSAVFEPEPDSGPARALERATGVFRRLRSERALARAEPTPRRQPETATRRNRMDQPARVQAGEQLPAWHVLDASEVIRRAESAPDGLGAKEAEARLSTEGPNAIAAPPRRGELRIFLDQLASTPVALLGASSVVSAATGGIGDAAAILAVVGINATIGYVTESGAERTIAAITRTDHQSVPVLRDGAECELAIEDIVRGDVLLLRAGVFLAADARVLAAHDLTIDESSLTGESLPVSKSVEALSEANTPLADRTNMAYRGTLVTGGSGTALVVATGPRTEIGHIQELAGSVEQRVTPMQQQLDQLGKQLAIGAVISCLGILGLGLLRGQPLLQLVRTAVSLGVAAVPEGLPTVAMTTLALGLSRMRDERVLVRNLNAVETLGATQVVCLDKTGTLTVNRMTVVAAQAGMESCEVRQGKFLAADSSERAVDGDIAALLRVAVLCNEVQIEQDGAVTLLKGTATESALVQVALDAGVDVAAERARAPQRSIQRRAQARNYMSTLHAHEGKELWTLKGRPSEVLSLCGYVLRSGERAPLGEGERAQIELDNERMAGRALRVLGFAQIEPEPGERSGSPDQREREHAAPEFVWVGLVGMEDPPRPGVNDVLARFRQAGLRTVMITGDQSATAQAVARQIGLSTSERLEIVDSTRLDSIAPGVLGTLAQRADVFSRVSPAHKLHIVRALQQAGFVVAMTGDGVNDGPALKAADIGVAMGAGGSVAARELADVVLETDELEALIRAIEQGRTIYDDIRKAVRFILATNLSELLFTFICVAGGVAEPLTPIQLLWINLLTDIFPELALATQPPEADVLTRPPRDPGRPMFTSGDLWRIALEGSAITGGVLATYYSTQRGGGAQRASTVAFTNLMFAQLLHAFSARSETHGIFHRDRIATNRWLPIAVGGTALVQLVMTLMPPLRRLLGVVPLNAGDWGKIVVGSIVPFLFNEGTKLARTVQGRPGRPPTLHPVPAADAQTDAE